MYHHHHRSNGTDTESRVCKPRWEITVKPDRMSQHNILRQTRRGVDLFYFSLVIVIQSVISLSATQNPTANSLSRTNHNRNHANISRLRISAEAPANLQETVGSIDCFNEFSEKKIKINETIELVDRACSRSFSRRLFANALTLYFSLSRQN